MEMKAILEKIARDNGVSVQEVEEEIQKAIDEAWDNPKKTSENELMQSQIKLDGSKPTPEELIRYCTQRLKDMR